MKKILSLLLAMMLVIGSITAVADVWNGSWFEQQNPKRRSVTIVTFYPGSSTATGYIRFGTAVSQENNCIGVAIESTSNMPVDAALWAENIDTGERAYAVDNRYVAEGTTDYSEIDMTGMSSGYYNVYTEINGITAKVGTSNMYYEGLDEGVEEVPSEGYILIDNFVVDTAYNCLRFDVIAYMEDADVIEFVVQKAKNDGKSYGSGLVDVFPGEMTSVVIDLWSMTADDEYILYAYVGDMPEYTYNFTYETSEGEEVPVPSEGFVFEPAVLVDGVLELYITSHYDYTKVIEVMLENISTGEYYYELATAAIKPNSEHTISLNLDGTLEYGEYKLYILERDTVIYTQNFIYGEIGEVNPDIPTIVYVDVTPVEVDMENMCLNFNVTPHMNTNKEVIVEFVIIGAAEGMVRYTYTASLFDGKTSFQSLDLWEMPSGEYLLRTYVNGEVLDVQNFTYNADVPTAKPEIYFDPVVIDKDAGLLRLNVKNETYETRRLEITVYNYTQVANVCHYYASIYPGYDNEIVIELWDVREAEMKDHILYVCEEGIEIHSEEFEYYNEVSEEQILREINDALTSDYYMLAEKLSYYPNIFEIKEVDANVLFDAAELVWNSIDYVESIAEFKEILKKAICITELKNGKMPEDVDDTYMTIVSEDDEVSEIYSLLSVLEKAKVFNAMSGCNFGSIEEAQKKLYELCFINYITARTYYMDFSQFMDRYAYYFSIDIHEYNKLSESKKMQIASQARNGSFKTVADFERWFYSIVESLSENVAPGGGGGSGPSATAQMVYITEAKTREGKLVDVDIMLAGDVNFSNIGIEITYDTDAMTLVGISENYDLDATVTTAQEIDAYPYNICFDNISGITFNGRLATLTFEINEDAQAGEYEISVDYYKGRYGDYVDGKDLNYDADGNPLDLAYEPGCIEVYRHIAGDIDDNGRINNHDATMLIRYLAGWDIPEINEYAVDVNGDGFVDNNDGITLLRYLAGWDIEIY